MKTNLRLIGGRRIESPDNIETRPIFTPMNKLKMYEGSKKKFTNSLDIYNKGISLPSYPVLKRKEIYFIFGKINNYLENF